MKVTDSRGTREAEKKRTNAIDADIARYGESYARIWLGPDGLQMEHVPRNMVRPVFAIAPPASKPE